MLVLETPLTKTKPVMPNSETGGLKPIKGTLPPFKAGGFDWFGLNKRGAITDKAISVKTPPYLPTNKPIKTVKTPTKATIEKPLQSVQEQTKTAKKLAESVAKNTQPKSIKSKIIKFGVPVLVVLALLYLVTKGSKTKSNRLK